MPTSPEEYFLDFCASLALTCQPVPTASDQGEKRPDYLVTARLGAFHVELKAVTPNENEQAQLQRLYSGAGSSSFSVVPGARMRELIGKANPQLKAVAASNLPGVLAIINDEPALNHHTEAYAVLTAMRGLDVVPVLVPKDPSVSPVFQEVRSGPKKRMTASHNTTISAILVPYLLNDGKWVAEVYHNRLAARPLPKALLDAPSVRHWRIRLDEREWEAL